MNKLKRKKKGYFKYIKRLKNFRLSGGIHTYIYKTTGTPCSCIICSPGKYEEKAKYRKKLSKEYHNIEQ